MRKRFMRAIGTDIILLPLFVFCFWNATLLTYALRMLKGELTIVIGARNFADVYADPQVSDSIKSRLHLIDEIKQFAYDSIGLKHSDNYTSFYDQHNQRLMYVVTAAPRYELQPYLWHFPVLGNVPYKGFFDDEKAKQERDRLIDLGYDCDIGGASGWSTLGWFRDPVLSSMLRRSEGDLAELIIHELTHGTIFVKDSVEYNENFAEFVGHEGANWFLRTKYGIDSREYRTYTDSYNDDKIKTRFMLRQAHLLDSVYRSFGPTVPVAEKEQQRNNYFHFIWGRALLLHLADDTTFGDRIYKRLLEGGNTIFLQYTRYDSKQNDFSEQFAECGYDLRLFVSNMVSAYNTDH